MEQFHDGGNEHRLERTGDRHDADPLKPGSPLDQGFALRVAWDGRSDIRPLDRRGLSEITFQGQYPIGRVEYRDARWPVAVSLEAHSPFISLNADDSSLRQPSCASP